MNLIWKRILLSVGLCLALHSLFGQYHRIDSLEILLNRSDDTVKATIQNAIAREYISVDVDKASHLAQSSRQLAHKLRFTIGELNALRTLSDIYIRTGDLRNALSVNKQCVDLAIVTRDQRRIAMAKGFLGMTYRYMSYDSKAFEELTEAINLFHKLGDNENEASFSLTIGNIYLGQKDYAMARKYYTQALELSGSDLKLQHVIYINLGEIDQEEGNFRQSLDNLDKALGFFEQQSQPMYVAYILYLKGKAYQQLNELTRSISYHHRALELYQDLKNSSGQSRCLLELGTIALKESKNDEALGYFQGALNAVKDQRKFAQLEKIHLGMVEAYKRKGLFEKSFQSQVQASICKDSLHAVVQKEKLKELELRYESDLSEQEIVKLKAERSNYYIIMGLLIALILASGFIIFLIFKRHKVSIQAAESGKKELEVALEAKEEITKNLKLELEFKVKELTSFTLNMIQKKEILEGIKKGMEEIREQVDGEARAKLNKILSTINLSQRLDKDWDNFKLYFEQVHQGFFDNLTAQFPDLNSNDIRLCALLRLNLDTKQIASVMDIAPESAKVAKHRIRKKLGLSNTDNLHLFFTSLGSPVVQAR